MDAFEKLIQRLPKSTKVLDVGSCGTEGGNTTLALLRRFKDVTGINITAGIKAPPGLNLIQDNYYAMSLGKYDLLVLDLGINENLLKDWTESGLRHSWARLNPGGHLILYVMTTDDYGDELTPQLIRWHANRFWGTWPIDKSAIRKRLKRLEYFKLKAMATEERRPYITWVMLQKK